MSIERIRNFAIIAHIDHGKSTLSDRLIERAGGVPKREMTEQLLDSMDIERERGITIKANTIRLNYLAADGVGYELNLIDTPGHVDFSYEVSRSLTACEGAILVVDATQGVEAQTLAHVYQAIELDLEVLLVLNKVDLPAADVAGITQQVSEVIGLDTAGALGVSAKTGYGVDDLLEAIVTRLPAPAHGDADAPLRALLIDSWYDQYLGVVVLVRIVDGVMNAGQRIRMLATGAVHVVERVGIMQRNREVVERLTPGNIGFFTAAIKEVEHAKVGDTVTLEHNGVTEPLPGFKESLPVVFCGIFPIDAAQFEDLRGAVGKLRLNDSAFSYEMETSGALGQGFRCGFLGLLHLEIVVERLQREFSLDLMTTAPSVVYEVDTTDGVRHQVRNPADMPDSSRVLAVHEPWIDATIFVPEDYIGAVLKLCEERRGRQKSMAFSGNRMMLEYALPLNEVVFDFYDRLKSVTRGYASFDYTHADYQAGQLVKLDILVNGDAVDAFSMITHREKAESRGRALCERLKGLIPRHLFKIPLQAAIGAKVVARETISAMRKDVTAKCYGGDFTRKRKLLEKQKAGKKRMRQFGSVSIPQDAFIRALRMDDD